MSHTAELPQSNHLGFIGDYFLFPNGYKAVSNYKKVIEITTDENSLKESKKIITLLKKEVQDLPIKKENLNLAELAKQAECAKNNQHQINKMFSIIENLFMSEDEVKIDDAVMLNFLAHMKEAKELIDYISDYITLVFDVNKAETDLESKGKAYSLDEFLEQISPKAA